MAPSTRTRAGAVTRTRNGRNPPSLKPPSQSNPPTQKSRASARTKQGRTNPSNPPPDVSEDRTPLDNADNGQQLSEDDIEDNPAPSPRESTQPDLQNYTTLFKEWPMGRIKKHLQENKTSNSNRAPAEVQDQVKLLFRNFNHELSMLAMIGGVSLSTIKSYL